MSYQLTQCQYYAPDYELDVRPSNMDNANSPEYLEKIKNQVIENLKRTTFAPSVQMTDVPRDPEGMDDEADAALDDDDEDENKDQRMTKRRWEKYVEKEGELSESEDEEENQRNGVHGQPRTHKRHNMMDYQNPDAISDDEDRLARSTRARSRDCEKVNGAHPTAVTNGSGLYDSSTPSPAASQASMLADDTAMQDADIDVEMADDSNTASAIARQVAVDGPQEATPPDSPPTITVDPATNAEVNTDARASTLDNDAMPEEPQVAHENGSAEREEEDVVAEKATEIAQRSEEV